ncbi:MAG: hypothetical protein CFE21_15930 [Bacteroidetes bacterium B1(2017)]|nr:MAG: hypothetical protein CFE21_15930 [Bacteroidetes bacterium B1(2017)]
MKPTLFLGSIVSLLAACGPSAEEKSKAELFRAEQRFEDAMTDSVMSDAPSYLISKHQLKGKTKDLNKAVEFLEMYAKQRKGYVENSTTNREILGQSSLQISADTLAQISNYRMVAELTLRIPYFLLDSALQQTSSLMSYVDERTITNHNAEIEMIDATFQQASHETSIENSQKTMSKSNLKAETVLAQTNRNQNHMEQANQARVQTLKLQDKIMYSTLHISLYEEEKTQVEKHLVLEQLKAYEPNFFLKLWASILEGAKGLEKMILFLVSIWSWILAAWVSYKAFYIWRRNFARQ